MPLLIGWFYITVISTLISKQKKEYCSVSSWKKNKTSTTTSSYSSLITNLKGLIVPRLPFSYFYSGRSPSFLEAAFPSVSKTPILGTGPELRKTTTIYGDVLLWRQSVLQQREVSPPAGSPSFAEKALQRLEGSCPGFLGFAAGLRSPCPWLCLPQWTWICGISHTLPPCSKEGRFPQIDSQPVSWRTVKRGLFSKSPCNANGRLDGGEGWRDSKPVTGNLSGEGPTGIMQVTQGDPEQGPANLNWEVCLKRKGKKLLGPRSDECVRSVDAVMHDAETDVVLGKGSTLVTWVVSTEGGWGQCSHKI